MKIRFDVKILTPLLLGVVLAFVFSWYILSERKNASEDAGVSGVIETTPDGAVRVRPTGELDIDEFSEGTYSHSIDEVVLLSLATARKDLAIADLEVAYPGSRGEFFPASWSRESSQAGANDLVLTLPLWPPSNPGTHQLRITHRDGTTEEMDFYWKGLLPAEATTQTEGSIQVSLEFPGIGALDFTKANRVIVMRPDRTIEDLGEGIPNASPGFVIAPGSPEGEYTLLVRMEGGQWYWASVVYPEDF